MLCPVGTPVAASTPTHSQLYAGFYLDLHQATGARLGIFHFNVNDRIRRSLSKKAISNQSAAQEVYGGQVARLTNMSYEQRFAANLLELQFGFFPFGNCNFPR